MLSKSSAGARETRMISASPRARLARLDPVDRQLLLLLLSLGADKARGLLDGLVAGRRSKLAPLVAEIAVMPAAERHALFADAPDAPKPDTQRLNARLAQEPPRLATLLIRELAPRKAAQIVQTRAADPAFARTLARIAARWLAESRK